MSSRRPNYQLVKTHRNYTVEEAATLLGTHRNTVRRWIKDGLPTCDDRRPQLILGRTLSDFLKARRESNKRPCQPGQIYCVACRNPKEPAGNMADYQPRTATAGNLIGLCPSCDRLMYRRVSLGKLEQVRGSLDVAMPQALTHISESTKPSVNSDFGQGVSNHDKAQSI